MKRGAGLALTAALLLTPLPAAAADPPMPIWHGVWRGTIGPAAIHACFDGNGSWKRGSYFYRSRLEPIRLEYRTAEWAELDRQDKPRATIRFDRMSNARIEGRWSGGGKTLPLSIERVPTTIDADDGPCGSLDYIRPRLASSRVVERRMRFNGLPYRKLTLVVGASFKSVDVESFALFGSTRAIARINRALARPLTAAGESDGWLGCMRGNLRSQGIDGDYAETLTPTMIGRRWLTVDHQNGGFCGGAHPYSSNVSRTFDFTTGAEIDLYDWLTARAVKRERFDRTSGESKTLTPAFRAVVLAGWKHDQDECDEVVRTADYWGIALTASGMTLTPSLPHAAQACADPIALPFARIAPYLTPAGKAAVATVGR